MSDKVKLPLELKGTRKLTKSSIREYTCSGRYVEFAYRKYYDSIQVRNYNTWHKRDFSKIPCELIPCKILGKHIVRADGPADTEFLFYEREV